MTVPLIIAGLQALVLIVCGALVLIAPQVHIGVRTDWFVARLTLVWRTIDVRVIDDTVNSVGLVVRGWGSMLRGAQTGSVRVYTVAMCAVVVAMIGYYLWR